MPVSTVVSIAASWPTAPAGVRGYPVGTPDGPCSVAGGTASALDCAVAGTPDLLAVGSTCGIGAAAISSRHTGPVDGRALVCTVTGTAGPAPVNDSTASEMRKAS